MNTFWALYIKELKESRSLMGFLLVGIAALQLYAWYYFDPALARKSGSTWQPVVFFVTVAGSFIAPSFLLARSFSSEWKSETHYQWFALPVRKWITVLCKFATAVSQGIVLLLFSGLGLFLISLTDPHTQGKWGLFVDRIFELSVSELMMVATDVSLVFVLPAFTALLFTLALVTAMEGVKFTVHRRRGLMSLLFFAGVIYLFGRFFEDAVDMLGFLGRYKAMSMWQVGPMSQGLDIAIIAYPIIVTTTLVLAGLWLFEKRVEI